MKNKKFVLSLGNAANKVDIVTLPKGTKVLEGKIALNYSHIGGETQVYIFGELDIKWFKPIQQ